MPTAQEEDPQRLISSIEPTIERGVTARSDFNRCGYSLQKSLRYRLLARMNSISTQGSSWPLAPAGTIMWTSTPSSSMSRTGLAEHPRLAGAPAAASSKLIEVAVGRLQPLTGPADAKRPLMLVEVRD